MSTLRFLDRFPARMESVKALTAGLVDYAGLFPPAALAMPDAVRSYAEYFAGPDAGMLGRFIVPAGRVGEFSSIAAAHLPKGGTAQPWTVSAILGENLGTAFLSLPKFNYDHRKESGDGLGIVDTIEIMAHSPTQVERVHSIIQGAFRVFVEVPVAKPDLKVFDAIAKAGLSAKIRTGGIEARSFPHSRSVVDFMAACRDRDIAFKATAGLHHVLCGSYALTYETRSPKSEMFGFLNVFLAAAFLYSGADSSDVEQVLCESDPAAFTFEDSGIQWRSLTLSVDQIRSARRDFALSFGSCSFTEPVQELKTLIAQQAGSASA
jgi:hypothetical protein